MSAAYYSRGCQSEKLFDGLKIKEDSSFSKISEQIQCFLYKYAGIPACKTVEKWVPRLNRIRRDLKQEYPDVGSILMKKILLKVCRMYISRQDVRFRR